MNLQKELNPQQCKVVTTTEGPVLVLAGAGSGKTRSVIYRTAYLINEKKINPWNILVVTFTNKAARELKDRLENTFGISARSLWIGTFHSVCTRILRYEEKSLPFNSNFSIYDESDQKSVIKKVYKKLDVDPKKFPPGKVREIISRQKNSLILPKDFFNFNESNYFSETTHKIYKAYQNFLSVNNALDFDDLLMYTAILFHDNAKVRKKYEKKFQYVMIDEYQDTNYAQFKIINLIAKNHQNLCVVGDDDQAIYSWRGADIRNILSFEADYKNVIKIKLEQNYRSPKSFLDAANSLIRNNTERHKKVLWTDISSSEKPELVKLENENKEAEYVAREISQLQSLGKSLNECVVLYRTNAQSRVFENAFSLQKIRYQIVGGVNFYQRKEVKDILAYLKVLVNPADEESFLRIINVPSRGIGKMTIDKLSASKLENNSTYFDAIQKKKTYLSGKQERSIAELVSKLKKWKADSEKIPVTVLTKNIIEEFEFIDYYEKSKDPKDISRSENIREFIAATEEFSENYENDTGEQPVLIDFLQQISLQTDLDNVDEDEETVKLMTMHNAKGLEFDNVYIVGVEDGLLPHSRSMDTLHNLEDITRAKKSVKLCYTRHRRYFDTVLTSLPSRFLLEIDEQYIKKEDNTFIESKVPRIKTGKYQKSIILESQKYFNIGQKIKHDKFGEGMILDVSGSGNDAKLTISFSNGKLKKIIGTFVKTI
jgi:DNA helicase-2/ATP-dependent DNA helicase PcrA